MGDNECSSSSGCRDLPCLIQELLQNAEFIAGMQSAIRPIVGNATPMCENPAQSTASGQSNQVAIPNRIQHFNAVPSFAQEHNCNPRSSSTSVREEIQRLFPSVRPHTRCSSNEQSTVRDCQNSPKKRKYKEAYASFTRELILLPTDHCTKPVARKAKANLYCTGNALSAVRFEKAWGNKKIKEFVHEVFSQKLPPAVDFEFLIGIGHLIAPVLAPLEVMDGCILSRIYHQKTIYV